MPSLPSRVSLVDVGPRDGLQNEKTILPLTLKIKFVDLLSESGVHEIEVGSAKHLFAVNPLRREESDLAACSTGRFGAWTDDLATAPALIHLAWIPMLIVLSVLSLHMYLAVRQRQ